MSEKTSLDQVLACPDLPTLPAVAIQVLELTCVDNVEVREIARAVELDPALAAKILKVVNSSYYALSQPCPTITRAVSYLGMNTVKSLVLGFSLVDLTGRGRRGLDLVDYWRRSIYSAAAARRLAACLPACNSEEAFTAALMQDIGMLAMNTALESRYTWVLALCQGDHARLPEVEDATLGFHHAEAGARLAEKWGLPRQLLAPIRYHHGDQVPVVMDDPLVRVVELAYQIYALITGQNAQEMLEVVTQRGQELLGLSPLDINATIVSTASDARELSRMLQVNVGEELDIQVLLAEAQERLQIHQRRLKSA